MGIIRWLVLLPLLLAPPYLLSNRLHWRPAIPVPRTALDDWIPYRPDLTLLYLGLFPLIWLAVLLQADAATARRVVLGAACCAWTLSVFFVLAPTAFPRTVPADGILAAVHRVDVERNACPSLHGCYAGYAAAWIGRARGIFVGALATIVALLIIVATIAVRQHGIIDLAAGAAIGVAAFIAWRRRDPPLRRRAGGPA